MLKELYGRGKLLPSQIDPSGNTSNVQELIEKFTRKYSGIDVWGTKTIHFANRRWSDVSGGMKGLVEVSIIRNAIAHGKPIITTSMENRAKDHHLQLPWALGDEVKLNIKILEEYRSRLRSFSRVIATGAAT